MHILLQSCLTCDSKLDSYDDILQSASKYNVVKSISFKSSQLM